MNRFSLRLIFLPLFPLFSIACFHQPTDTTFGTIQLEFKPVFEETYSAYTGDAPKLVVIQSEQDWESVWENEISAFTLPIPPPPEIDFSSQVLFAVFLGQRTTGGYTIQVTHITSNTLGSNADVLITAQGSSHGGQIVTQVITSPVQVVSVVGDGNFSVEDAALQIGTSTTFIPAEPL